MKSTGIVRRTDKLGRVVIPKELRKLFGFENEQEVEIYVDKNHIILRKFS